MKLAYLKTIWFLSFLADRNRHVLLALSAHQVLLLLIHSDGSFQSWVHTSLLHDPVSTLLNTKERPSADFHSSLSVQPSLLSYSVLWTRRTWSRGILIPSPQVRESTWLPMGFLCCHGLETQAGPRPRSELISFVSISQDHCPSLLVSSVFKNNIASHIFFSLIQWRAVSSPCYSS